MCSVADTFFDAERRVWSGPKVKAFYSAEMTIGDVAYYTLTKDPNMVVQVMDPTREKLTARDLLRQSKSVALNFLRMGMEPGDIVGISASNTSHLTAVVVASFFCGMPINAIYPEFDKETVKTIYGVSKPKIIFCDVENYKVIKEASAEINLGADIYILNGEIKGVANITELFTLSEETFVKSMFPCSKMNGDSAAIILCSSGTTGPPKGVICSHTSLLNQELYYNLRTDSVVFAFSTLYWGTGIWTLISALKVGIKRIITNKPFTPEYFVQLIETHKITHTITAPSHMIQFNAIFGSEIREKLNSLDYVYCGGAKVPDSVSQKFDEILGNEISRAGLVVVYGMSELSGGLSANDGGVGKNRIGTEGKLLPNTEVRIVDKNNKNLGIGEEGTIFIRQPYKWAGYYNNSEATDKIYKNGWLNTGDIGKFDKDGYLNICSRDSDVFKTNSFQVYPQNIEKVIMELPGVLEVCVFGVPDFVATNLIACAIVLKQDENGQKLTKADVELHVKNKLADVYHLRGGVFFMESLPHTGSGKIMRRKVLDSIKSAK